MYFLRCDKCGHFNPVVSEYTVYCGKCKTHLVNNYVDWIGANASKDFDDYKQMVCVPESDVPKQSSYEAYAKPQKAETKVAPVAKRKSRLSKAQLVGIVVGAVAAGIFGYLGKKAAIAVRENWEISRVERMDFPASDTSSWKVFNCSEANFTILFPENPIENSQEVETEIGNLEVKQYLFEPQMGKDANILYGTGFTIYPAEYIDNRNMDEEQLTEFFTNSVNGTVSNVQGRLLSTHIINYKGYPGREIKVDIKDGLAIVKMRSYLIHNRMYILQVISPAKNTFNKSINYFLDSFELKE